MYEKLKCKPIESSISIGKHAFLTLKSSYEDIFSTIETAKQKLKSIFNNFFLFKTAHHLKDCIKIFSPLLFSFPSLENNG